MAETELVKVAVNGEIRLGEIWGRLNDICQKLWSEDRVTAIGLQALIEEYKSEVGKSEQLIIAYRQALEGQKKAIERVLAAKHEQELNKTEEEKRGLLGQLNTLGQQITQEQTQNENLRRILDERERKVNELHEEMVKREALLEEKNAIKLKEIYEEFQNKKAAEENLWDRQRKQWAHEHQDKSSFLTEQEKALHERSQALEKEYQEKNTDIQKKYEELLSSLKARSSSLEQDTNQKEIELLKTYNHLKANLDDRETKLIKMDDELSGRERALQEREKNLEQDYRKKTQELDIAKEGFKEEVSRIIKEYKTRQAMAT